MRVLVADNDPEALDLVVLDLGLENHAVLGVHSGGEALSRLAKFGPDVLVLDYRMPPGPTGLDVAAIVRAVAPGIRIILYTNYQNVEIVRRAKELEIAFLPKGNLRALRALVAGRPLPPEGRNGAAATAGNPRRTSPAPTLPLPRCR